MRKIVTVYSLYQEKRCGTISCFFGRYGIISCVRGAVFWHILYSMDAGIGIDLNPGAYYDDFRNTEEGRDT